MASWLCDHVANRQNRGLTHTTTTDDQALTQILSHPFPLLSHSNLCDSGAKLLYTDVEVPFTFSLFTLSLLNLSLSEVKALWSSEALHLVISCISNFRYEIGLCTSEWKEKTSLLCCDKHLPGQLLHLCDALLNLELIISLNVIILKCHLLVIPSVTCKPTTKYNDYRSCLEKLSARRKICQSVVKTLLIVTWYPTQTHLTMKQC